MKPEEIIKKYEEKKADNFKMIESAKGDDAQINTQWLYRINELFDEFINDVKKLNGETRKDFRKELIDFCNHGGIQVLVPTKANSIDELVDDYISINS